MKFRSQTLTRLRKLRGMTQNDVTTSPRMSRLESGGAVTEINKTLRTLVQLAKALKVSPWAFVEDDRRDDSGLLGTLDACRGCIALHLLSTEGGANSLASIMARIMTDLHALRPEIVGMHFLRFDADPPHLIFVSPIADVPGQFISQQKSALDDRGNFLLPQMVEQSSRWERGESWVRSNDGESVIRGLYDPDTIVDLPTDHGMLGFGLVQPYREPPLDWLLGLRNVWNDGFQFHLGATIGIQDMILRRLSAIEAGIKRLEEPHA